MAIRVLPPELVSQIAAGEVIERPASVVKELIENSLDAGATQITVEARGGGISLIRVTDNGSGIPAEEVELAFQRYATSKIQNIQDLEAIASLGFRGEALPSIAAVAAVEVFTLTPQEKAGTFLSLKDGVVREKLSRGRSPGTTITVRNLFYNLPARRKFLKSQSTENSHIANVVSHYALAFPEVRFTLYLEGKSALRTSGQGDLRGAALEVYGLETAEALLEVKGEEGYCGVGGLVGPPRLARSGRAYMSFFVNRRWVRSPLLLWAVEEAYHGLLMTGKHPIAILNLTLTPSEVDVNVHPAKAEVRFRQERAMVESVQKAIRHTLSTHLPLPSLQPAALHLSATPQQVRLVASPPKEEATPIFAPTPALALPMLRVLGQVSNLYIIAEGPEGVYLIDQHAAHERVLYEKVQAQRQRSQVEVQGILEPLVVEFLPAQVQAVREHESELSSFGFTVEPFGERSFLVRAVPALLANKDIVQALHEVVEALIQGGKGDWEERITISLACHGSVRAGQTLSAEEMRELVRLLEATTQPRTCPHGRPTMVHLSAAQLEKEFGRH